MLISVKDLVGGKRNIKANSVFRIRPTYVDSEPANATMIDLVSKRIYSRSKLESLVKKIDRQNPLVQLTTPVGLPVWVSAERVEDIAKPISVLHHKKAKAVVTIHVHGKEAEDQQVTETVRNVVQIIENKIG